MSRIQGNRGLHICHARDLPAKCVRQDDDAHLAEEIDFVIPWVDGADKDWLEVKRKYDGSSLGIEDDAARYRDWGLLRYWFRGVERFAPWVRKIHFVTWGHYPDWLNLNHPKLHIVNHEDYIPDKYLPTFSANTIELNFHRIDGLADNFVYFNDDMFLINAAMPVDFFEKGMPKTQAIATPLRVKYNDWFFMPVVNNAVINRHFSFHETIRKHPFKWLNPTYGLNVFRTLSVLPYPYFCGMMEFHLPNPLTKSAYEEVWAAEGELLDSVCKNRVRKATDVNQYLIKNWQIAQGKFNPASSRIGKVFQFGANSVHTLNELEEYIKRGRGFMVCINDTAEIDDIDGTITGCRRIMDAILPSKSTYEL